MRQVILTTIVLFLTLTIYAQITLLENGRIGVGVENPSREIDISSNDIRIGGILDRTAFDIGHIGYGNWAGLKNRTLTTTSSYALIQHLTGITLMNAASGRYMELRIANSPKVRLSSNGNFGIGTRNPTQKLSVNGTAGKTGGGDWLTFSDKKVKKNINDFNDGLDEVLKIRPVTFQYNGKAGISDTQSKFVGVIAQEIQKIAPYTVEVVNYKEIEEYEDDNGELKSKVLSDDDFLQFDGTAVTYMLVNAIKELKAEIDDLNSDLKDLRESMTSQSTSNDIKQIVLQYEKEQQPALFQNRPNPTDGVTTIAYYLPEQTQLAKIFFYSVDGKLLKQDTLTARGYQELQINTDDLSNGVFYYQLEVDGQKVDQKSIVVAK